jgi:pimeloyl-ACP methyl ester carboxylesterase
VALCPLSFHVNRVHRGWGREIDSHLARRKALHRNEDVHAFNCVVSDRLDAYPERFFWGGLQSYGDVLDLVREVRAGRHPHVHPEARVDLLGYSIGGYLALGLLLLDEGGLFAGSRAVIFESGAALRATNMSSRFIIDHACEVSLMKLYVRFTGRLANDRLSHWLRHHELGRWFRALCGDESERPRLEARLRELAPRLLAIANRNDAVIPAPAILNTLQGLHRDTGVRVQELSLGVHEHPFLCPDYAQRDRRFVTEFLDLPLYGDGFERFVEATSGLLGAR